MQLDLSENDRLIVLEGTAPRLISGHEMLSDLSSIKKEAGVWQAFCHSPAIIWNLEQ